MDSDRQRVSEKLLLIWIIDQMQPFATVDNEQFQNFVRSKLKFEIQGLIRT